MGDRCTTHKARACQKCAGDAGRFGWFVAPDGFGDPTLWAPNPDRPDYPIALLVRVPSNAVLFDGIGGALAALAEAESDLLAGDACGAVGCRALAEWDRLTGVVAKVRELADRWESVLRECKESDPRWILDQTVTTLETARWELCVALGQADLS